ncbi:hypothetical protein BDB01DRAFT_745573, partial [Pilobolus umbonatus]
MIRTSIIHQFNQMLDLVIYFYSLIYAFVSILQQKEKKYVPRNVCRKVQPIKTRKIRKPKSAPINKFPNEILLNIMGRLENKDLFHCITVNNHWNALAIPLLWRHARPTRPLIACLPSYAANDIRNNIKHVHKRSHLSTNFPIYQSQFGCCVKSIDLSLIAQHVTDCTIGYIIKTCLNLISLNLSNCTHITNEGLRLLSNSDIALQLKVLALNNCEQVTDEGLHHLSKSCQSLVSLHLGHCHRITFKGVTCIVYTARNTLRRISLTSCDGISSQTISIIATHTNQQLEWLDISKIKNIRHMDLVNLVKKCPNLTRLNLGLRERRQPGAIRQQLDHPLLHYNTNSLGELIETLRRHQIDPPLTNSIAQQHQRILLAQRQLDLISNHSIELVITHLKKLEILDISNWSFLTDSSVRTITHYGTSLQHLNLSGCYNITRDILNFLSQLS